MSKKIIDAHVDFLSAMDTADKMAGIIMSLNILEFDEFADLARDLIMHWTSQVEI